jgi:hypothetical protein
MRIIQRGYPTEFILKTPLDSLNIVYGAKQTLKCL